MKAIGNRTQNLGWAQCIFLIKLNFLDFSEKVQILKAFLQRQLEDRQLETQGAYKTIIGNNKNSIKTFKLKLSHIQKYKNAKFLDI